jgi:glyoxylase-like metal-dependent hydrolase (beta-lactamase superfamily II)
LCRDRGRGENDAVTNIFKYLAIEGEKMAGPVMIVPNVYGILGNGVNMFLIDDPETGVTLIDAGLPGAPKLVLQALQSLGREMTSLKHILITHADIDHVCGLKELVKMSHAEVVAGDRSVQFIQSRKSPPHVTFPMSVPIGIMNVLMRRSARVTRIVEDREVLEILDGVRVFFTPGHTEDHVCYYLEKEGVLFAGDLFDNRDGFKPNPRFMWDEKKLKESAERMLSLSPHAVCPGHGQVWFRK